MHIQREGAQLQIRGTWSAGPGDDQARFLADLRALRDSAAIGYDELAARAHYPSDVLKEAENGPALPGLPILTAYVRACEGDVLDWEERWRRLNPEVADDPSLPVRPAGASAAAVAGARAGIGVAPPDVYDPDRIKAALRGERGHGRSDQAGRRSNDPGVPAQAKGVHEVPGSAAAGIPDQGPGPSLDSAASWGGTGSGMGWDTATDPAVSTANGNHLAALGSRGPFDAAFTSTQDSAEPAEPAQGEEFSWLNKSEPESGAADSGLAWQEPADTASAQPRSAEPRSAEPRSAEPRSAEPRSAEPRSAEPRSAEPVSPEPAVTERLSRYQADGLTSSGRTDFWGQPLASAAADLQVPAAAPRAEEPVITRAAWTVAADTAATQAAESAHRASTTDAAFGATTAPSHSPAAPVTQAAATERDERRPDRLFPARLLVVIVIAALIGSLLVLLLK
jgi:hypothetical protein